MMKRREVTLIKLKTKLKDLKDFMDQRYSIPPEISNETQFFARSERMFRSIFNILETMIQLSEDNIKDEVT